jgi:hypothetical protein
MPTAIATLPMMNAWAAVPRTSPAAYLMFDVTANSKPNTTEPMLITARIAISARSQRGGRGDRLKMLPSANHPQACSRAAISSM